MGLERRKLRADLTGFAHADGFSHTANPAERDLESQLTRSTDSGRLADHLLTCLRQSFAGPHVIPAGFVVEVLAKASGDEGDTFLIVRSAAGVYAHVLDSLTEPA